MLSEDLVSVGTQVICISPHQMLKVGEVYTVCDYSKNWVPFYEDDQTFICLKGVAQERVGFHIRLFDFFEPSFGQKIAEKLQILNEGLGN